MGVKLSGIIRGQHKSLIDRVANDEFVSNREIQSGLNSLLGTSQPGHGKHVKLLSGKLKLPWAKHL